MGWIDGMVITGHVSSRGTFGANKRSHHQYSALFTRSSLVILPGKLSLNILQDDIARARLLMLSSPLKLRIAGHHTQSHPACAACASQMMLGVILFVDLGYLMAQLY